MDISFVIQSFYWHRDDIFVQHVGVWPATSEEAFRRWQYDAIEQGFGSFDSRGRRPSNRTRRQEFDDAVVLGSTIVSGAGYHITVLSLLVDARGHFLLD